MPQRLVGWLNLGKFLRGNTCSFVSNSVVQSRQECLEREWKAGQTDELCISARLLPMGSSNVALQVDLTGLRTGNVTYFSGEVMKIF